MKQNLDLVSALETLVSNPEAAQQVAQILATQVAPQQVAPQPQPINPSLLAALLQLAQQPQQVAPQQVEPQQVAPQQVAPQQVEPQQVAPQQVAAPAAKEAPALPKQEAAPAEKPLTGLEAAAKQLTEAKAREKTAKDNFVAAGASLQNRKAETAANKVNLAVIKRNLGKAEAGDFALIALDKLRQNDNDFTKDLLYFSNSVLAAKETKAAKQEAKAEGSSFSRALDYILKYWDNSPKIRIYAEQLGVTLQDITPKILVDSSNFLKAVDNKGDICNGFVKTETKREKGAICYDKEGNAIKVAYIKPVSKKGWDYLTALEVIGLIKGFKGKFTPQQEAERAQLLADTSRIVKAYVSAKEAEKEAAAKRKAAKEAAAAVTNEQEAAAAAKAEKEAAAADKEAAEKKQKGAKGKADKAKKEAAKAPAEAPEAKPKRNTKKQPKEAPAAKEAKQLAEAQ